MEQEQHIKVLKKLIQQNEQVLAEMKVAMVDLDQKRMDSERKHRTHEVSCQSQTECR